MTAFESFAKRFVRCYWETFKSGKFPMPPNEQVEESIDELLAPITIDTEESPRGDVLLMRSGECWWKFTFRRKANRWEIAECSAPSLDPADPHDLLAIPYETWFRPMLTYVTECAQLVK